MYYACTHMYIAICVLQTMCSIYYSTLKLPIKIPNVHCIELYSLMTIQLLPLINYVCMNHYRLVSREPALY